MDSFEWNKVAGAVLFALLLGVGLTIFSDVIFSTERPEEPGYIVAVAAPEATEGTGGPAAPQPIGALLAAADPHAGATSAKKCGACHDFTEGGPNKVGPNLYAVVNRPIAAHPGYEYSDAMKKYAEEAKTWTFENLGAFVHDPKGTVPETKMAFAGLKDKELGNVIAYLNTLSASPAPLPPATAGAAPAEGTQVATAAPTATATDAGTAAATDAPAAAEPTEPQATIVPPAQTESSAPAQQPAMQDSPAETTPAPAQPPAAQAEAPAATPAPAPAAQAEALATSEEAAAPAPAPAEQQVAQTETPAPAPAPAAAPAPAPAGGGDATKGANFAKRCFACHDFKKGGPNKVGPNLHGVVGRVIAGHEGFAYSDAMKKFAEGGKVWDDATLDAYLADPKGVIPGNKMAFPGVKSEADRANVIAYLKTLAD